MRCMGEGVHHCNLKAKSVMDGALMMAKHMAYCRNDVQRRNTLGTVCSTKYKYCTAQNWRQNLEVRIKEQIRATLVHRSRRENIDDLLNKI